MLWYAAKMVAVFGTVLLAPYFILLGAETQFGVAFGTVSTLLAVWILLCPPKRRSIAGFAWRIRHEARSVTGHPEHFCSRGESCGVRGACPSVAR